MSDTLPRSSFSSEDVPKEESFGIWHDSISPLFIPTIDKAQPFFASVEAALLEEVVFAKSKVSGQKYNRNKQKCRKDQLDNILLQLYLSGSYCGSNGRKEMNVNPGDIGLLDLAYSVDTHTTSSDILSIIIPRSRWVEFSETLHDPAGLVLSGNSVMGMILANHIKTIWQATYHAKMSEKGILQQSLLSVASHCFESTFEQHQGVDEEMRKATLRSVQIYIYENLGSEALKPEMICQRFKFSRSYLYQLFSPLGGVSQYIQGLRLERCYQELISPKGGRRKVAAIAFDWGFKNQSHFSRLFSNTFDITPRQAQIKGRDLKRQQSKAVLDNNSELPDYFQWLRSFS